MKAKVSRDILGFPEAVLIGPYSVSLHWNVRWKQKPLAQCRMWRLIGLFVCGESLFGSGKCELSRGALVLYLLPSAQRCRPCIALFRGQKNAVNKVGLKCNDFISVLPLPCNPPPFIICLSSIFFFSSIRCLFISLEIDRDKSKFQKVTHLHRSLEYSDHLKYLTF